MAAVVIAEAVQPPIPVGPPAPVPGKGLPVQPMVACSEVPGARRGSPGVTRPEARPSVAVKAGVRRPCGVETAAPRPQIAATEARLVADGNARPGTVGLAVEPAVPRAAGQSGRVISGPLGTQVVRPAMVALPILAVPLAAPLQAMPARTATGAHAAAAARLEARGVAGPVTGTRAAPRAMAKKVVVATAPSLPPTPRAPAAVRRTSGSGHATPEGAPSPAPAMRPPPHGAATRATRVTPGAVAVRVEATPAGRLLRRPGLGRGRLAAITPAPVRAPSPSTVVAPVPAALRPPFPAAVVLRRQAPRVTPLPTTASVATAPEPGSSGAEPLPAAMAAPVAPEAIVGLLTPGRQASATVSGQGGVRRLVIPVGQDPETDIIIRVGAPPETGRLGR